MGRHVASTIGLAWLTWVVLSAQAAAVDFSGQLVAGSDVGRFSSVAVDAAGRLVAAYYDAGDLDHDGALGGLRLWHDSDNSGTFDAGECRTIDAAGATGTWASLAFDGGGLANVSYFDAGQGHLRLWHDGDGDFDFDAGEIRDIDTDGPVGMYTDLAFDSGGLATVSYFDDQNGYLRLWHDADGDFAFDPGETHDIDTDGQTGLWTSLEFDGAGLATVAYFDSANHALKVWHDADGDFAFDSGEIESIDASGKSGLCASLKFDAGGLATVAYFDDLADVLRVWHDADGDFAFTAGEIADIEAVGPTVSYPALGIDSGGKAVVCYYDATGEDSKRWYDADGDFAYDSGEIEVVESDGDVGLYNALTFDLAEHLVAAYFDNSGRDLRVWRDGNGDLSADGDELQTIDVAGYQVGYHPSAGFNPSGEAVLAYIGQAAESMYVWHDADGDLAVDPGETSRIDDASSDAALAFDAAGLATVSYFAPGIAPALRLWHDANGDYAADAGEIATIGTSEGTYTSLAFDPSGLAVVAFFDWNLSSLQVWHDADGDFAFDEGELEEIDDNGAEIGRYASVAFDEQGRAVVAYHAHYNFYELRLWYDADGDFAYDAGEIRVIDTPVALPPEDSTGKYTSIVFDADWRAVVTYYRGTWESVPGDLRLWYDADGSLTSDPSELRTIDSVGQVGRHGHLALDGGYRTSVLYADSSNEAIKFWFDANGDLAADAGEIETLDEIPRAGDYNALAIRGWDQTALVAYYDKDNHGLVVGSGELPAACSKGGRGRRRGGDGCGRGTVRGRAAGPHGRLAVSVCG